MIDLTPLDVRKKKGDFRRAVRGYDTELVDDFLDMVAERLEELVKQNVALTERSEHLQEQVASYREREKALNEALVTAQQLRTEALAQADKEADLIRREAHGQAERILEEGQRSVRELQREMETLQARRSQFVRAFRTLLERHISDLDIEEPRRSEPEIGLAATRPPPPVENLSPPPVPVAPEDASEPEPSESDDSETASGKDWMSSLVVEGEEDEDS